MSGLGKVVGGCLEVKVQLEGGSGTGSRGCLTLTSDCPFSASHILIKTNFVALLPKFPGLKYRLEPARL